jgi:hypothetical protein
MLEVGSALLIVLVFGCGETLFHKQSLFMGATPIWLNLWLAAGRLKHCRFQPALWSFVRDK